MFCIFALRVIVSQIDQTAIRSFRRFAICMSSAALKSMKSHKSVFKWSTCSLVRGLPCYNRFYLSRSCQLEPLKKYVLYYKLLFEPWRFTGKTRPCLQPFISTVLLPPSAHIPRSLLFGDRYSHLGSSICSLTVGGVTCVWKKVLL